MSIKNLLILAAVVGVSNLLPHPPQTGAHIIWAVVLAMVVTVVGAAVIGIRRAWRFVVRVKALLDAQVAEAEATPAVTAPTYVTRKTPHPVSEPATRKKPTSRPATRRSTNGVTP